MVTNDRTGAKVVRVNLERRIEDRMMNGRCGRTSYSVAKMAVECKWRYRQRGRVIILSAVNEDDFVKRSNRRLKRSNVELKRSDNPARGRLSFG